MTSENLQSIDPIGKLLTSENLRAIPRKRRKSIDLKTREAKEREKITEKKTIEIDETEK